MASMLQEYFVTSYKVTLADSAYDRALLAADKNDSTVAHSEADIDTLYERAAVAQKALAGFFMFKLQIPDSAIKRYEALTKYFPKSKTYPSALYTLGEYYYSSGDTVKGRKYLDRLSNEHPESNFAVSASSLLGTAPPPHVVDSSQVEYDAAMDSANAGNYSSAIAALMALSKKDRKSLIVPHALYALGWIYENKMVQPDSAFVYYKKLATQYPSSELTSSVTLALMGFEQAQLDSAATRKRAADSIANVTKPTAPDSVKPKKDERAVGQVPPPRMGHSSLLPSQKNVMQENLNREPDSLGAAKSLQVDSLANPEKSTTGPKKPEK
jgi:TolA-binding protein